jgi:hypothetical protein
MRKINWFGIVAGSLTLIVLAASIYYPWWQIVIGQDLLKINASPLNLNFGILNAPLTVPLIWALNLTSILFFLSSGILMLVYSVIPTKPYSKEILGYAYKKPLYALVFTIVSLIAVILLAEAVLNTTIPLMGSAEISLPQGLLAGANISVLVTAAFQWPFWLAVVAVGFCVAARIYHRWLTPEIKDAPVTTVNEPQGTTALID